MRACWKGPKREKEKKKGIIRGRGAPTNFPRLLLHLLEEKKKRALEKPGDEQVRYPLSP